jgi:hypothetical protein
MELNNYIKIEKKACRVVFSLVLLDLLVTKSGVHSCNREKVLCVHYLVFQFFENHKSIALWIHLTP